MKEILIKNKIFGKLKAIKFNGNNKWGKHKWIFLCDCGKTKEILKNSVLIGSTRSCGCNQGKYTHGMSRDSSTVKFYRAWSDMKQRCLCRTHQDYINYGGRGISVCKRWLSFIDFKKDMYDSFLKHIDEYGPKQTTLDRINNNLGYSPKNCRWATYSEQINNRRPR